MGNRGRLFAALIWLSLGSLVLAQQTPPSTATPDSGELILGHVDGAVIKAEGAHLLVGLKDGGVASFDPYTKKQRFHIPGDGTGEVQDVVLFGNQVWWSIKDRTTIRTAVPGKTPFEVDLSAHGLGPIRRIGVWQQMIVVHADNGCRFIDPMSWRVLTPSEALPPEVAAAANQGVVTTHWKEGSGLFVVVRRFESKQNAKPGESKDLGILTAWSAEWRGAYTLLGSYTSDLVAFKDESPTSVVRSGPYAGDQPTYSSASIGNIKVGPEGILALDGDEALTIPFYKDNWITERVKPKIAPQYAQATAYSTSGVWWVGDGKLIHASLEDGETDVYVPRKGEKLLGVAADEDGAWVIREGGIRRINQEELALESGFIRYSIAEDEERPGIGGQSRLAWVLKANQTPGKRKLAARSSIDFVREALKAAGVPGKRSSTLDSNKPTSLTELQYGDVVLNGGEGAFYIGNGKMLGLRPEGLLTRPLELSAEARIYRFFSSAPKLPYGAHSLPIADIGPVFPIGVGRAISSLGHDLFVRVTPGAPWDQPHMPSHFRLLSVAEDWVGTPYRWGGQTMDGTDCSGFVMSVFSELGIKLPRHSQWMARAPFGEVVFDELRFGDVLVFPHPKHVAIYIGDGRTVETTRGAVGYSTVSRRKIAYVRRFLFE